jgi:hypothetical protein
MNNLPWFDENEVLELKNASINVNEIFIRPTSPLISLNPHLPGAFCVAHEVLIEQFDDVRRQWH